jgi:hypothetical protein
VDVLNKLAAGAARSKVGDQKVTMSMP